MSKHKSLADFIAAMGDREFSELIGCSRRAATDWRLGNRSPRPEWARKIIRKTGGRVTWSSIYAV